MSELGCKNAGEHLIGKCHRRFSNLLLFCLFVFVVVGFFSCFGGFVVFVVYLYTTEIIGRRKRFTLVSKQDLKCTASK